MDNASKKPFLGLSFQPEQLCLVEIEDGLIQALAARELVQPFGIESFHTGGQFLDSQIEILQDLYQGMGAKGKDIGVVLDGGMVLLKKIPVALGLQEEMIREHIMWEAEQLLVSLLDEYIVEYQRLPFQTQLGNPFYVLILVRKRVMEGIQSLIEKCGFLLKEVDVDVFSIIRTLLVNYDINPDQTFVLVHVQRQYLSFIFIRQREYFLSYRVSLQEDGSVSQIKQSSDIVNVLLKELRRLVFGHRIGRGIDDLDSAPIPFVVTEIKILGTAVVAEELIVFYLYVPPVGHNVSIQPYIAQPHNLRPVKTVFTFNAVSVGIMDI